MKVVCEYCKRTIDIEPFIYDERIITERNISENSESYKAVARVKFFCHQCGQMNDLKNIESKISIGEICSMIRSKLPHYTEKRAEKYLEYEER